jgi:hypothetical protein
MKNKIPSLTGFWDRILLSSSKKDARLVISDAVNSDEAVTKRQLDAFSTSLPNTRLIAWNNSTPISTSVKEEDVTLATIPIPSGTFSKVGQSIEIDCWASTVEITVLEKLVIRFDDEDTSPVNTLGELINEVFLIHIKAVIQVMSIEQGISLNGYLELANPFDGLVDTYIFNPDTIFPGDSEGIYGEHNITFITSMAAGTGTVSIENFQIKFIDSQDTNLYTS